MDFVYIFKVLPSLEQALWLTLKISFFGIINATVIGVLLSLVIFYRIKIVSKLPKLMSHFFEIHHFYFTYSFYILACQEHLA